MQNVLLEKNQVAPPQTAAINAALAEAEAGFEKGEGVTLEQSRKNARERHKAWQKNQQIAIPA